MKKIAVPAEAEGVYVLSICLVYRVFFLLHFFTAGDGCNGPQASEKLAQGLTLTVSCATVSEKTHIDSCNKISDTLFC